MTVIDRRLRDLDRMGIDIQVIFTNIHNTTVINNVINRPPPAATANPVAPVVNPVAPNAAPAPEPRPCNLLPLESAT